jgi:hypothetical protein
VLNDLDELADARAAFERSCAIFAARLGFNHHEVAQVQ